MVPDLLVRGSFSGVLVVIVSYLSIPKHGRSLKQSKCYSTSVLDLTRPGGLNENYCTFLIGDEISENPDFLFCF